MPPLLIVIFSVLIGWPLVKLVATVASRGRWERQRSLKTELENNPHYGELERRVIADKFEEGKGSLGQLALPFVAFFGGLAAVFALPVKGAPDLGHRDYIELQEMLLRLDYPNATPVTVALLRDKRFITLSNYAFELEMLRYPIATAATILAIVPALLLMIGLYGLKSSLDGVVRRIIESSRQTVKTFTTLLANAATSN